MMFMKGDKKAPFCKFSKQSVELLNELNIEYGSFDILTDEEVSDLAFKLRVRIIQPRCYLHSRLHIYRCSQPCAYLTQASGVGS